MLATKETIQLIQSKHSVHTSALLWIIKKTIQSEVVHKNLVLDNIAKNQQKKMINVQFSAEFFHLLFFGCLCINLICHEYRIYGDSSYTRFYCFLHVKCSVHTLGEGFIWNVVNTKYFKKNKNYFWSQLSFKI